MAVSNLLVTDSSPAVNSSTDGCGQQLQQVVANSCNMMIIICLLHQMSYIYLQVLPCSSSSAAFVAAQRHIYKNANDKIAQLKLKDRIPRNLHILMATTASRQVYAQAIIAIH